MKDHRWFVVALLAGGLVGIGFLSHLQRPCAAGGDAAQAAEKAPPSKTRGRDAKPDTSPIPADPVPAPSLVDPLTQAVEAKYHGSAAYEWLNVGLAATAREHERHGARPTIGSRNLAIVVTAMYDAWAAYDARAVGTRLGDKLRRPPAERTAANKAKAMGYALGRVLLDMYPEDAAWITEQLRKRGVDPSDTSTDLSRPPGVGNTAAAALIVYRHHDGSNQLGDEVGSNGKPYADWTFYKCVNKPGPAPMTDPNCWQPIPFDNGKGGKIVIGFLTPHWYRVKPFALERSDQFRPGPPPKVGSEQLKEDVDECIAVNTNLTVEQKAVVEFMRDGPKSTGQSGHWLTFAKAVSRRDKNGIDRDVKLFFAVGNVCFDAFISCWETKRYYDSSRPWSLVRYYYKGKTVKCWGGPGKGVIDLPAEQWHPYSPSVFVTPPFPGYTSGHSTVSAAGSTMLKLFTGSDRFGDVEKRKAGVLTEPGFECKVIMMRDGKVPAGHEKRTCDVALALPTFTATAEMAAVSRLWGGYHIRTDNEVGLDAGRKIAKYEWPKIKEYFNGTAKVRR
ncbi:MAG TPA: vanadium-dependent haloperoxidase [Gemmataceae bacterium]|nr:vanadium-dependent haloperoxidase [Gemmataceae bacterium]